MSETPKFTPGPWRTSRNAASTDSFYVLTAGEGQMFQLQICARASEANAYLIAAAPELYALVLEMVACLDEKMVEQHDSGGLAAMGIAHSDEGCSLCKARRVIAKAEGRK